MERRNVEKYGRGTRVWTGEDRRSDGISSLCHVLFSFICARSFSVTFLVWEEKMEEDRNMGGLIYSSLYLFSVLSYYCTSIVTVIIVYSSYHIVCGSL